MHAHILQPQTLIQWKMLKLYLLPKLTAGTGFEAMAFFYQTDEDRAVKKNRNNILNSSKGSASSRSIEKKNDFDFLRDVRCLP